jgi:putative hydrolase
MLKTRSRSKPTRVDNGFLAEALAHEAENAKGHTQKAFRRAARAALLWPEDAVDIVDRGESLTTLPGIGPFLEKTIKGWLKAPPVLEATPAIRREFITMAQARRVLKGSPQYRAFGDLQMHSNWSDGSGTIRDMADAGIGRGYKYLAITDHSKGLKIAGGINEAELREQRLEIDAVNSELKPSGFRVLHGLEMNINPAGGGDMEPKSLETLDIVVGSFHSKLRVTEDQTERYLAALRNPHVHILGHPRGRVYNFRLGLSADWERVFAEAARLDKAVEVDAYPDRQDLDVKLLTLARDAGVKLAIDTDAHHPEQLDFIELGLAAAALVRFPPERIINFWTCDKLLKWAKNRSN